MLIVAAFKYWMSCKFQCFSAELSAALVQVLNIWIIRSKNIATARYNFIISAESDLSETFSAFAFKVFSWRSHSGRLAVCEQAGVLSLVQGHFGGIRGCLVCILSVGMMKTCDLAPRGQFLILSFKSRDEQSGDSAHSSSSAWVSEQPLRTEPICNLSAE